MVQLSEINFSFVENLNMKRKVKEAPDLSLAQILPAMELSEDDCFGRMWNPSDIACTSCAAKLHCGIIFDREVRNKAKRIEEEHGTYLDNTSFDGFDQDDFVASVILNPGVRTVDELFDILTEVSQCPDEETIVMFIKSMMSEHRLKTVGGKFYPKPIQS